MTNSAWKTPHFFACYAKRSAETGKCSPTFVWLLPAIFDLLSVSAFRKNNILDSSKKRGESDRSGRSRSLYKISKKINCNKMFHIRNDISHPETSFQSNIREVQ